MHCLLFFVGSGQLVDVEILSQAMGRSICGFGTSSCNSKRAGLSFCGNADLCWFIVFVHKCGDLWDVRADCTFSTQRAVRLPPHLSCLCSPTPCFCNTGSDYLRYYPTNVSGCCLSTKSHERFSANLASQPDSLTGSDEHQKYWAKESGNVWSE